MADKKSKEAGKVKKEESVKKESKKSTSKKTVTSKNNGKNNAVYKNIGLEHKYIPKEDCNDDNCPYHGSLRIRGKIRQGVVVSTKANKTAIVEWTYLKKIPKYKRYMKSKSRVIVHNPSCVNAKVGDVVKIGECKPISKTKHFVLYDILN